MFKPSYVLVLLALGSLALLPLEVPRSFSCEVKVYPRQRWVLRQSENGSLQSQWVNFQSHETVHATHYAFERGDIVQLAPMNHGKQVAQGDSLSFIESFDLQQRLLRLQQQVAVQRASLLSGQTGAKPPVIANLRQQLRYAEAELELAQQNYDRTRPLYEQAVVSEVEYMQVANELRLAEIGVELVESELWVAQTGRKPEEIALLQTQLRALEAEVALLQQKQARYCLRAPFGGTLVAPQASEELQVLEDRTRWVLGVALPVERLRDLRSLALEVGTLPPVPLLERHRQGPFLLNDTPVWLYLLPVDGADLRSGQWLSGKVHTPPLPVWQYLQWAFR